MSVNSKMTAIADAIRNLLDISGTMGLDAMANNISSITKRGAVAGMISTKSEQYIIPAGYHNGNGSVGIADAEQAKIIAENIKNGVTILGVSGTASGDIYAIIAVTYPEGSTCTCSDGTTTLTARDTSGYELFNVKAGTYTVECHTSDNSRSNSVIVTVAESEKGQVKKVTLAYELMLYSPGNEHTAITGGWVSKRACTITKNTDNLYVVATMTYDANSGVFATANKIDLTHYSRLYYNARNDASEDGYFGVGVWASIPAVGTNPVPYAAAYVALKANTSEESYIDISSLSGEYYVGGVVLEGSSVTGTGYLYEMKLAP